MSAWQDMIAEVRLQAQVRCAARGPRARGAHRASWARAGAARARGRGRRADEGDARARAARGRGLKARLPTRAHRLQCNFYRICESVFKNSITRERFRKASLKTPGHWAALIRENGFAPRKSHSVPPSTHISGKNCVMRGANAAKRNQRTRKPSLGPSRVRGRAGADRWVAPSRRPAPISPYRFFSSVRDRSPIIGH